MAWLKKDIMYKVVRHHRLSLYRPGERIISECERFRRQYSRGEILHYVKGETVVSKNGLCECDNDCCRGIHAHTTREEAGYMMKEDDDIIIRVKGKWWSPFRGSTKVRAERVEVLD